MQIKSAVGLMVVLKLPLVRWLECTSAVIAMNTTCAHSKTGTTKHGDGQKFMFPKRPTGFCLVFGHFGSENRLPTLTFSGKQPKARRLSTSCCCCSTLEALSACDKKLPVSKIPYKGVA